MQPSPVTVAVTPAQLGLEQRRTFGTTDKNIEELGCLRFGFQMWPLLTVLLHGAVNIQEPQNHLAPKDAGSHDFGNWNSPLGVSQEDRERAVEVVTCSSPRMKQLENTVTAGLDAFQEPEMIEDGMGGSYVFKDKFGSKVAIIKPADEEALGPNNPKGYIGRLVGEPGWKPAVRVGEAALREVAAYLLDHNGFAKVPTSSLVRARHPVFCYNGADAATMPAKLGSLQEFVPHKCDTSEMGPCKFSTSDVHRIGLLDIRLFNTDRHAGNMLVKELPGSQYELIPIDHGFCLPEALEAPYFEWLHWPQAMSPFSEDELQYIQNLDIEADKKLLQKQLPNLRPGCIRVLEVTTELLKRCAKAGMTLHEIGNVMTRAFVGADEEPSELEKVCVLARQAYQTKHAHRVAIAADVCRIFRRCHTPDTLMRQLEEYAAGMKQQGVVPASVALASGPVDMESFEELGWDLFKQELVLLMEDSIKTGKWRVAA